MALHPVLNQRKVEKKIVNKFYSRFSENELPLILQQIARDDEFLNL